MVYGREKKKLRLSVTTKFESPELTSWDTCSKNYFIHPAFIPRTDNQSRPNFDHDIALIQTFQPMKHGNNNRSYRSYD